MVRLESLTSFFTRTDRDGALHARPWLLWSGRCSRRRIPCEGLPKLDTD